MSYRFFDCPTAMYLTNVEEFENFHFEAEGGVDQDQDEVGHFGDVDHHVDVVRALQKSEPALFPGHDRHGALDVGDGLAREVLDQALQQRRLADLGRADDGDDDRRRLRRRSVDDRNSSPLLSDVFFPASPLFCPLDILNGKGFRVSLPGRKLSFGFVRIGPIFLLVGFSAGLGFVVALFLQVGEPVIHFEALLEVLEASLG